MKKILSLVVWMLAIAAFGSVAANDKSKIIAAPDPVIQDIIRSYQPWTSVEFSGKAHSDKLPLSPTVKMYMVRDSLIQISLRAPLIGEVGRLDLTCDRLTIVNKMSRTYCQEPAAKLIDLYPSILSDVQSLFLARVVVLGSGELSNDNSVMVDTEDDGNGDWMVIPNVSEGVIPFNYGYLVSPASRTKAFLGTIPNQGSVEIIYSYPGRGMTMDVSVNAKGKKTDVELELNSVKWGGSAMAPIKLTNYRQVSVKEFLKGIKN